MEFDWNVVAERKPQGYVELNDGKHIFYGPVESVEVDKSEFVYIKTKWIIRCLVGKSGAPSGEWEVVSATPHIITQFPNFMVHFVIEDSEGKGPRVLFGINMIYFDNVHKVDDLSQIRGLKWINPT